MVEVRHIRKLVGHIACKFVIWWTGLVPIFIDYKSYTMVPGVAVPQDFLKMLLECDIRVESDALKFQLRINFEPLTIQFYHRF